MPVVRSAYRQTLKHLHKSAVRYGKPDEMCFAVFGRALSMDDFAAAGYGRTPQQVARSLFSRPSMPDVPCDKPARRLAGAFDLLRRLSEVAAAAVNPQREGVASGSGSQSGKCMTSLDSRKAIDESDKGTSATAGASPPEDDERYDDDEEGYEGDNVCQRDEYLYVQDGPLFIESPENHKVRKIFRSILLCMDSSKMPPYHCVMSPEPFYPNSVRVRFPFPLMRDAMVCMAASAAGRNTDRPSVCKSMLTEEDYDKACDSISTRTITVTDHIEVELRTEYQFSKVCDDTDDGCEQINVFGEGDRGESSRLRASDGEKRQHIFRYFVFIRNYGPRKNKRELHAHVLSRHLVIFDKEMGAVTEVVGPGVLGNLPLLPPGTSHFYESGLCLYGQSGVMRGTFQVNTYNESGESHCIDVHIAPTFLRSKGA